MKATTAWKSFCRLAAIRVCVERRSSVRNQIISKSEISAIHQRTLSKFRITMHLNKVVTAQHFDKNGRDGLCRPLHLLHRRNGRFRADFPSLATHFYFRLRRTTANSEHVNLFHREYIGQSALFSPRFVPTSSHGCNTIYLLPCVAMSGYGCTQQR